MVEPGFADASVLGGANFYGPGHFTTDVATGVTRDRAGTRVVSLTDDFLIGFHRGLAEECGDDASREVLTACGRTWGERFGRRFRRNLSDHHGLDLMEQPYGVFQANLVMAFASHGWGDLHLDLSRHSEGLIVATVGNAVMGTLKQREAPEWPADTLLAGILAGLFSVLSEEELGCVETDCIAHGAPRCRFVITAQARLDKAAADELSRHDHEALLTTLAGLQS